MDKRIPEALLKREIAALCERYRVTPDEARAALVEAFESAPGLLEEIAARHPDEDVTRMRAYKDAVKSARKTVYYQLRQYRRPASDAVRHTAAHHDTLSKQIAAGAPEEKIHQTLHTLMQSHVSTAERDQVAFHRALAEQVKPPATVIDLGCGLQPLALGRAHYAPMQRLRLYVAVDRAPEVIRVLKTFAPLAAPARLEPVQADLTTFEWTNAAFSSEGYDLALMLKLVPVLHRQHRRSLAHLAEVPARRVLITGSVEALARRESIRAREDRALQEFIALTGRRVVGDFEAPGEFGYVLE